MKKDQQIVLGKKIYFQSYCDFVDIVICIGDLFSEKILDIDNTIAANC